jgi:hypothetical protein
MAQSKNIGHGWSVARVTAGPTTLGQVRRIIPPTLSREKVEATDLSNTVKYHLPSDPEDVGELTVEMFWTSGETNDELLDTDFNARTIASWKFVAPSPITRTATFDAWVMSLSPAEVVSNGVIIRTITWCLTTAITWT